jgi:hypothetical protein
MYTVHFVCLPWLSPPYPLMCHRLLSYTSFSLPPFAGRWRNWGGTRQAYSLEQTFKLASLLIRSHPQTFWFTWFFLDLPFSSSSVHGRHARARRLDEPASSSPPYDAVQILVAPVQPDDGLRMQNGFYFGLIFVWIRIRLDVRCCCEVSILFGLLFFGFEHPWRQSPIHCRNSACAIKKIFVFSSISGTFSCRICKWPFDIFTNANLFWFRIFW